MEQAWEQLSSKFQLLHLHPTISIEEERKHYGEAKRTVTEREARLADLQHQLTQAERDADTARTVLDGLGHDRDAIEHRVNEAFNRLNADGSIAGA
jgi:septal ring factor EnvC (AmiA/AmiB activator)